MRRHLTSVRGMTSLSLGELRQAQVYAKCVGGQLVREAEGHTRAHGLGGQGRRGSGLREGAEGQIPS